MKLGIFGGTFDPIHLGHIMVAEEARASLGLDEVILVPAGQPLLKPPHPVTPAEHRLRMLCLAVEDRPYLKVSSTEIERAGPSYTVDTLADLSRSYINDELYFILGWGSLAQLPEWREPARIIEMCRLVAVPRPGCQRPSLEALESDIPGVSKRVVFLDRPRIGISSSAIRERVARGLPVGKLVPAPVADYIRQHKLYLTR